MIQFKVCFGLFRSNLIGEEFMLKYPDGTKDILSPFQKETAQQDTPAATTPRPVIADPEPLVQQAPRRTYPCDATIKTKQGTTIKAVIISDDGTTISYKRQSNPDGPTYKLQQSAIREIKY